MLPAILFPLCGIMSSSNVAKEYFNNFHFLLVGVVCLATSIEKWGLHRRVALRLVTLVGVNPAWLLLGFMSGCAFLSMWVQNTSAVTMVMPIVDAVLQQILKANEEGYSGEDNPTLELDDQFCNFYVPRRRQCFCQNTHRGRCLTSKPISACYSSKVSNVRLPLQPHAVCP
uniref:Solute carrier family 13 member 1 n=1 Tax=Haplochromis burtoni TaxID=8153 RepID=A0A3Q3C8F0_HAPBU